ncbi:homocitrate synthase [Clostridium cellulovorans]|nr:homocitrate synthase [Clostridium cellulovorans]
MKVKIVDTTLRDGEQKAGIALGVNEKVQIAKYISDLDVYQLEVGVPAMGGEEKRSIEKIAQLGLSCKIAAWNRMSIEDIRHSIDCNVDIIHISVPTSDIQINSKLNKDRKWVLSQMSRAIYFAKEKGYEVNLGFEDASRASIDFLIELSRYASCLDVKTVRYADTVGILYPRKTFEIISSLKKNTDMAIEIHSHNDFGMAISNSIAAIKAGAEFVDCTFGGIGERAGNCDLIKFLNSYSVLIEREMKDKYKSLKETERMIMNWCFGISS